METKHKGDRRKLWLLVPVLVLPFLAFAFYKLDGGSGAAITDTVAAKGINTALPDAAVKEEEPISKIGYYQRADRDSLKLGRTSSQEAGGGLALGRMQEDPQTKAINSRLELLSREISKPVEPYKPAPVVKPAQVGMKNDVDRLEALMKTMQEDKGGEDPEMAQLAAMMDKLIAVQNPELAKQLYQKPGGDVAAPDTLFKAIPAVIASNQKARQGSVVELRLLDTVVLSGVKVPKGHAVFGHAAFSNQRLNLEIRNVRLGNRVIPVNLTVYDQRDAMAGINAPEALLGEALGDGATGAMGSVGISGFDLTTQIAGAGIDAARSLLTKKIRRVKQNLKAGYPLLLRDNTKKLK